MICVSSSAEDEPLVDGEDEFGDSSAEGVRDIVQVTLMCVAIVLELILFSVGARFSGAAIF